ncbi:class F sortase [Streptomyces sp. BBFR2]|uniref:class F sortase n=1 Tax=Streptomyces sp. BBFR2 TaxID=3372854 RepID=UPI0037D9B99E
MTTEPLPAPPLSTRTRPTPAPVRTAPAPARTRTEPAPAHGHAEPAPAPARRLTGAAWAVLLLGLWLWGGDTAVARLTATGDIAAAGRPPGPAALRARPSLPATTAGAPRTLTVHALGLHVPLTPGPPGTAAPAASEDGPPGWYASGPQPGTPGVAVLLGRGPAAGGAAHLTPGARVDVRRADGTTARFTVRDVRPHPRDAPLPAEATAARTPHRPELRLITRGPAAPTAVVSATLSGYGTDGTAHRGVEGRRYAE